MPRLIDADELWKHKYKSASERMDLDVAYMGGWNDAIDTIVENAPTVDAIPVEWIRKWARKMVAETDNFNWGVYTLIMLEDWEEENAKID